MKQLPLNIFDEESVPEEPKLPEVFKPVANRKSQVVREKKACDLKELSPCQGPLYIWGIDSITRCALHITLQCLWMEGNPRIDLADWITAGGGQNIPENSYAVEKGWKLVKEAIS